MHPETNPAESLIHAARQALANGDRLSARRFAEQASALAPQNEEPWLVLAYLAGPKAAQFYISRALQLNPGSQRVLAAQNWLNQQTSQNDQPDPPQPTAPPAKPEPRRFNLNFGRMLRSPLWLLLLLALVSLAAMATAANQMQKQDTAQVFALQTVEKARNIQANSPTLSLTWTTAASASSTSLPSATATTTPTLTQTSSPSPTHTASPVPTSTSTAKPSATQLPSPTKIKNSPVVNTNYTIQRGDTLNLIAQRYNVSLQNLIAANNIANPSNILAGQVIVIPKPGQQPAASQPTAASPSGPNGSGKEIQIDISEQHLYAYQNKELVFSLVVSTGIGNSTRIGTFKVLDKIPNAYSNAFNIWMPYWLGIYYSGTLENGIHGLPLLWNGVELWGNLLGKPATYGCIESRTPDIKKLYDWAEIGTPVIIRQ